MTSAILSVPARAETPGYVVSWGVQVAEASSRLQRLVFVTAGSNHTLAVDADGSIVAWGDNAYGQ